MAALCSVPDSRLRRAGDGVQAKSLAWPWLRLLLGGAVFLQNTAKITKFIVSV